MYACRISGARQRVEFLTTLFASSSAESARPWSTWSSVAHRQASRGRWGEPRICVSAACSIRILREPVMNQIAVVWARKWKSSLATTSVCPTDDNGLTSSIPGGCFPQPTHQEAAPQDRPTNAELDVVPPSMHHTTTVEWVDHILAPNTLETMNRSHLTQAFKTITQLLRIAFSTVPPAHQLPILRKRSDLLRATLDPQLPTAIAALIARASYMTAVRMLSDSPQLHAPIALKVTADALLVAPSPLQRSVMRRSEAFDALSSLLQRCSTSKRFLQNPKFASMIFASLVTLRMCHGCQELVNKACYAAVGRVRTKEVAMYDLAAVEGLCLLISHFRKEEDQSVPRAWRIAMKHIQVLAATGTLPFGSAAHIAGSIANMGKAPQASVQTVLLQSAVKAVTQQDQELRPAWIAQFLSAATVLDLSVAPDIAKDLFMTALRCRRTHRLSTTMSMRVSLQTLEVQLNKTEEALWNKQILRCLKGASITETLRFLHDAQHIQMRLGDRFVTAVTKSIAAGLNRGDLHPDTADEAYQALSKIKRKAPVKAQQV